MRQLTAELSSWNNFPREQCHLLRPERYRQLVDLPANLIARGQGRSYGDAALNRDGHVGLIERLNRFLAFDPQSGILTAEAGVTLQEILAVSVPAGWFLPVVPGTQWATLGGSIAADVHGKNHPIAGSFGAHLKQLELLTASSGWQTCGPDHNSELFDATLGGMGLTGIIGSATLQLQPIESAWMEVDYQVAANLSEVMSLLAAESAETPYQVAWIDCLAGGAQLGRSIFMRARHAHVADLSGEQSHAPLQLPVKRNWEVPIHFPNRALNRYSVKAFNAFYYRWNARKQGRHLQDYQSFFFPLDTIGHWNRIYGKRGFVQYQCLIPGNRAEAGLRNLLERLSAAQCASFLAVIKRFGKAGRGLLSFPDEGYTLALDIPNPSTATLALLDQLDEQVIADGGRVYLAKDARLKPQSLATMYPRLEEWKAIKSRIDPDGRYSSSLGRRLGMEVKA